MLTRTFFARAPLAPGRFAPLPVGAVSAQGAMRDRLLALRGGLLSRCASLFPEAGEQSVWFGGALGGATCHHGLGTIVRLIATHEVLATFGKFDE